MTDSKSETVNKADETWLILPPESPCGCGSGKPLGQCHLVNGRINVEPQDIQPPGLPTGQSMRKCHFSQTNNCFGKMTGEHILSRAVLKHIDEKRITFIHQGSSRNLPLDSDSLKVNKLCSRHNAGTSKIDNQAGRLIEAVQHSNLALSGTYSERKHYLFSGMDIERWLLKTMLNTYAAKLSVIPGAKLPDDVMKWFTTALPEPFGLYIPARPIDDSRYQTTMAKEASMALKFDGQNVAGISVSLSGLELNLILPSSPVYDIEFQRTHAYRPKFINFFRGNDVVPIIIAWPVPGRHTIWISKEDPGASAPTGIY